MYLSVAVYALSEPTGSDQYRSDKLRAVHTPLCVCAEAEEVVVHEAYNTTGSVCSV